jgi:hypothetical protein
VFPKSLVGRESMAHATGEHWQEIYGSFDGPENGAVIR